MTVHAENKSVSAKPKGKQANKTSERRPAGRASARVEKDWNGWFRPLAIGKRLGPFVLVPVELQSVSKESLRRRRIIITVPRACGNAATRNRLRRVLRSLVEAEFALIKKTQTAPDEGVANKAACAFVGTPASVSLKNQKGIWIRVVRAERLGAKIRSEDIEPWIKKGASWLCSLSAASLSTK